MTAHTRIVFDTDLRELTRMVAEMGGLAERQIVQAFDALAQRNAELARKIIRIDTTVDAFQCDIEEKSINIITQHQPLAVDLREAISAMHISNDLERIGDLAKNIGKRVIVIDSEVLPKTMTYGLKHMTEMVFGQLKRALDSYAQRDASGALAVRNGDREIDTLNNSLFGEILTYMAEDPRRVGCYTQLLFCVKNLERVGDHATNIAEMAHYIVTGFIPASERPKADTTKFAPLFAQSSGF